MSYKTSMAYYQSIIVTVYNSKVKVFLRKWDADNYFMESEYMEWEVCETTKGCIKKSFDDKNTLYWTKTTISQILEEIWNLRVSAPFEEFGNLENVCKQAFIKIMDNEIEKVVEDLEA